MMDKEKMTGSVTLSEVASKASRIDIACTRCSRRGRYQLARLVKQFGGDYALPDLGSELANCPNRNAAAHGERCDVYFPGLAAILSGD